MSSDISIPFISQTIDIIEPGELKIDKEKIFKLFNSATGRNGQKYLLVEIKFDPIVSSEDYFLKLKEYVNFFDKFQTITLNNYEYFLKFYGLYFHKKNQFSYLVFEFPFTNFNDSVKTTNNNICLILKQIFHIINFFFKNNSFYPLFLNDFLFFDEKGKLKILFLGYFLHNNQILINFPDLSNKIRKVINKILQLNLNFSSVVDGSIEDYYYLSEFVKIILFLYSKNEMYINNSISELKSTIKILPNDIPLSYKNFINLFLSNCVLNIDVCYNQLNILFNFLKENKQIFEVTNLKFINSPLKLMTRSTMEYINNVINLGNQISLYNKEGIEVIDLINDETYNKEIIELPLENNVNSADNSLILDKNESKHSNIKQNLKPNMIEKMLKFMHAHFPPNKYSGLETTYIKNFEFGNKQNIINPIYLPIKKKINSERKLLNSTDNYCFIMNNIQSFNFTIEQQLIMNDKLELYKNNKHFSMNDSLPRPYCEKIWNSKNLEENDSKIVLIN